MKKVMIYGTLGPACSAPETLKKMFEEGMDGIRLNLSHTSLEGASDLICAYHKAAAECGVTPGLMIDMQGPELRAGDTGLPLKLKEGSLADPDSIPFPGIVMEKLRGSDGLEVLLDDGKILLRTEIVFTENSSDADRKRTMLRVVRGGVLESRKSIAIPERSIDAPAITEADRRNIRDARQYGVTAVMQPFVRSREDLIELRNELDSAGCGDIRLLAKIENRTGMERIDELIPYCDEIVIARGDLGNSMELWELPAAQKRLSAACRRAGRDFMVVTQMLDSMTHRQVPTRAEVSDIFNAVLDGASSVMVTGETAAGEYPELVIRYMSKTVREAERFATSLINARLE